MKKLLVITLLLAMAISLVACDGGSDTPAGMQLAAGGAADGYYFYVPEEWLVSNVGKIKSAYISRVNTTSVSFAEIELGEREDKDEYFFGEYFNESLAEFPTQPEMLTNGEAATFGTGDFAADKAQKYVYNYTHKEVIYTEDENAPTEYREVKFCFMQILVREGERYFIFTYSALATAEEGVTPNYERYLEKAQSVIDNFRFTNPTSGDEPEKDEPICDGDGFVLISDKALSGFELYVPESFTPDFSSGIVSATHEDGSNITVTKATGTGVTAKLYWEKRKAELESITESLTEIEIEKPAALGNASSPLYGDWCWSYEYEYVYNGKAYRVYQILALDGSNGYIFTYTAPQECFESHFEDIEKVIEKVHF